MKKMKLILTVIIAITVFVNVQASNENDGETGLMNNATASINGKVVDKVTGEALTGAKIVFEDLGVITYTDFDGNFTISGVKPGSYKIAASLISYSDKKDEVEINKIESGKVEIEMESVNQ